MKPFDIKLAAAGHPVVLASNSKPVRILCTNARGDYPVIGLLPCASDDADSVQRFRQDGTWYTNPSLSLVMAPIGQVQGRDVYPGDVLTDHSSVNHFTATVGESYTDADGFRWPKSYPETRLTDAELLRFDHPGVPLGRLLHDVANAAIRHGIDNGYLTAATESQNLIHEFRAKRVVS